MARGIDPADFFEYDRAIGDKYADRQIPISTDRWIDLDRLMVTETLAKLPRSWVTPIGKFHHSGGNFLAER